MHLCLYHAESKHCRRHAVLSTGVSQLRYICSCYSMLRKRTIHRCFTCKDRGMLVKAFKVYVRPILQYNSPVWSPSFVKDILFIESVQRKFTKRIPGMAGLTYHSRLTRLGLASLEVRRLRSDILLVYKILFGMVRVNSNEFFTLRNQPHLRGHKYVISKQRSFSMRRVNYFSNRIVNLWNNLPLSTTDFTNLRGFDKSVSNDYLLVYCKLNFTYRPT